MLSYRTLIYTLAMAASAEATKLALDLSKFFVDWQASSDYGATVDQHLPELKIRAQSLGSTVDKLEKALPMEVRKDFDKTKLVRHLGWINYWLNERSPASCMGDPVDIVSNDLPNVLKLFEQWYERQSPVHTAFGIRVTPQLENGQLNSALREAWPLFKTRMVEIYGLSNDLDGHALASKIFGNASVTAGIIPNGEREGFLNLLKGLYTLNRNLVSHNDVDVDPEVAVAVLGLINCVLVKIESIGDATNIDGEKAVPDYGGA